ncbi:MAG TPA: GNAT family N-acetyltransferase [Symbiobacteriaceae bacterium]|jgi:RimJ/RimL family protein N-acetyltransferase
MIGLLQPLETERLILRPFEITDAGTVRQLAGDREVAATTVNIPHPYPEGAGEQFVAFTREAAAGGFGYTYAVVRKSDGILVGCIGLVGTNSVHRRAELNYWIGRPYWRQGYASEAARRMVQFGFERLDLNKISAAHFTRNPASGKVMQKAGMTYEGTHRQDILKGGQFEDIATYSILRAEFEARR